MRPCALAIVLALAGCTIERDVLVGEVTTCTAALAGQSGQPCAFDGTCEMALPDGVPSCCTESAYCRNDALVVSHDCNPDCTPCIDDTQCQTGAAICIGSVCEPCPELGTCPACPSGWTHLERNGCPTCDCAPPAVCPLTDTTACSLPGDKCYRGANCSSGCVDTDPTCCATQCAATGCSTPIPVGCLAACTPAQAAAGCSTCATDHCDCTSGLWQCTTICAPGYHSSCVGP